MLTKVICNFMLVICFGALPTISQAYVGPGSGLSAIGSIIAFIGTVFLLIIGFLWYPIKRLLKGKQLDSSQATGHEISQENTKAESPNEEIK